jgi:transcriptional regulator NrdR family protein
MDMNKEKDFEKNDGLVCRNCGCHHFYTDNTRKGTNRVIRSRRCRNCGKRVTTIERVVGLSQKEFI